ncbi:hypothetical protein GW17_00060291 [Ensete ventricosum]|nr:hypothetical protein GW17_00060291 [Ensete ventricosum]
MRLNRVELFYALVAAIGSESRRCLRGRGGHMHAVCMQRCLATAKPPVGATTCGHGRLRPALPPAGVAAPWQGSCRPQRAAVACAGAATTTAHLRFSRLLLVLRACDYLKLYGETQWERGGYSKTHDVMAGDHNAW